MRENSINIVNTVNKYIITNNKKKGRQGASLFHAARNVDPNIRGADALYRRVAGI